MQVQIAVFGKNKEIIETLERVINNNEQWKAFCTNEQDELKEIISSKEIQIVLYSSGIGSSELEEIENWVDTHFPTTKQVHHYGGGSGLLKCEINSILEGIIPINKPLINALS
jgi:hypothetical protein